MATKKPVQVRQFSAGTGSRIYSRENVSRYSERARQRARSRVVRRVFTLMIVLAVVGAGGAAALTFAKSVINSGLSGGGGKNYLSGLSSVLTDANAARDPFNVLLLGTDGRPGEDTYRSDSIILAHVDPKKKTVSLVSIPRDTKVTYKGSVMKLTESHSYGGPEAVAACVEDLCGIDLNYYAEVSFDGMKALVDAVGGIDINVPEGDEVDDPDAGPVTIEAGQQHMDGEAALTFCRARHQFADGDYARMRHQRMVLGALANQILNNMDITKIPSVLSSLSDMLITTMDVDDILAVMQALKGLDTNNIWSANLPSYADDTTMVDGKSYVFVYEDALKEMMDRVKAGEDPKGPQTWGDQGGDSSATVGDLTSNNTTDWSTGTASTKADEEAAATGDSSSSSE